MLIEAAAGPPSQLSAARRSWEKRLNELLEARKIPANLQLVASFDAEDSGKAASILAAGKEEPIVMSSIESADLGSAQIVILAASKETGHKVYEKIRDAKPAPVLIDLSGAWRI